MPIYTSIEARRASQEELKELAHEAMRHVFSIHNDFGRLFDESVYKRELAARMKEVVLEASVDVVHGTFAKRYFADAIIDGAGLFEFKATDAIHPNHRSQVIHYLLLFDLGHGKVVNTRTERVEHEFVNSSQRLVDLRHPSILDGAWRSDVPGAEAFRDTLMGLIRDWGAGLKLTLYEEALTHFFGGEVAVDVSVPVCGDEAHLAGQRVKLVAPHVAFKLTCLRDREDDFAVHASRLVRKTSLKAIHWANIVHRQVRFSTIS
jgi:GxxExxY protein